MGPGSPKVWAGPAGVSCHLSASGRIRPRIPVCAPPLTDVALFVEGQDSDVLMNTHFRGATS